MPGRRVEAKLLARRGLDETLSAGLCWSRWTAQPIRWPRPAPSGPLRNRQGSMSARTCFAKVKPWTRQLPAVRLHPL